MAFFKKKRKDNTNNTNVKVADIYFATTEIISSHDDGNGCGPRVVTMYFLTKLEEGEHYELFSGKKLEKKGYNFDTPYVKKAEPLTKYLVNKNEVTMDKHLLFDFITYMNVLGMLKVSLDEEEEEA